MERHGAGAHGPRESSLTGDMKTFNDRNMHLKEDQKKKKHFLPSFNHIL